MIEEEIVKVDTVNYLNTLATWKYLADIVSDTQELYGGHAGADLVIQIADALDMQYLDAVDFMIAANKHYEIEN